MYSASVYVMHWLQYRREEEERDSDEPDKFINHFKDISSGKGFCTPRDEYVITRFTDDPSKQDMKNGDNIDRNEYITNSE